MRFLHGAISIVSAAALEAAEFDWQLQRHEGRDYVPLERVALFYGFPEPEIPALEPLPPNTKVLLESEAAEVEFTLKGRLARVNGVNHWLAFPIHYQDQKAFIARLDLSKVIEPALRPERISGMSAVKTIVLDAGHGGHDKGAVSPAGYEKDFTLDVSRRAREKFEALGFQVVMTRETDIFVPLNDRAKIGNRTRDSIFVSVHFNHAPKNPAASGFEIYLVTPRGAPSTNDAALTSRHFRAEVANKFDAPSAALANSIYHAMLGNVPASDRGVKRARFAVLRLTKSPSVLVEGGFLSNADERRRIASSTWRAGLADALVQGITGYRDLAQTREPTRLVADYRQESEAREAGTGDSVETVRAQEEEWAEAH